MCLGPEENVAASDLAQQKGHNFRQDHAMEIKGKSEDGTASYTVPQPFFKFAEAPFDSKVLAAFKKAGFTSPTPIQAQSWPIVLQGRDIISVARTGSGKTCAFLLPTFQKIASAEKAGSKTPHPVAVVLAPTRELAMQINEEASRFGAMQGMRSVCVFGGASKWGQINELARHKPQCIVATPGRLNDLASMGKVSLQEVSILILDEADRMLDMGFEPQLYDILSHMPEQVTGAARPLPSSPSSFSPSCRQTLFFTATWPKQVQKVAANFLTNPVQVNVGDSATLVANEDVEQRVMVITESEKESKLNEVLKELPESYKTIVFFQTKRQCQYIADVLWEGGARVDALHGDKEQYTRTKIMNQFKKSDINILCATDVAARGLDVKDITHVVNYDFPEGKGMGGIEDYVHRIGRTGRAGAKGIAITFFTRQNGHNAAALKKLLVGAKQVVPEELGALAAHGVKRTRRHSGRGDGGGGGGERREFPAVKRQFLGKKVTF